MSIPSKKKDATEEVFSLRNTFAVRARQAQQAARDLEEQARQKRLEAESLARQAIVLHQAYELMQQETNDNAAAVTFDSLSPKDLAQLGKRQFVFLIDGSGSMVGAPLNGALKSAQALAEKIVAAGGQVDSLLFGDKQPVRFDVLDEQARNKIVKGLNSGTVLTPSLQALDSALDKKKTAHIVIFSDGDMFDPEASAQAIQALTAKYPKVTLDALQITGRSGGYASRSAQTYGMHDGIPYFNDIAAKSGINGRTPMAQLFDKLGQLDTGGLKVGFADTQENVAVATLGDIIARRVQEKLPKPAAKPKAPKNAPGA